MGLSNTSLGYLNYPTQVIFKCCKLIPVMIGGVFIQADCFSPFLMESVNGWMDKRVGRKGGGWASLRGVGLYRTQWFGVCVLYIMTGLLCVGIWAPAACVLFCAAFCYKYGYAFSSSLTGLFWDLLRAA
ncbi:unnamed protein product [Boreogadus saida]